MATKLNQVYNPDSNLYLYSAKMDYVLDGVIYNIDTANIATILIDNDYNKNTMPMIFVTVNIETTLVDLMLENQDSGIVFFTMTKSVANSDMPDLFTEYISDEFIYFITDGDNEKLNEGVKYETTTIGLLSRRCINNNKRAINGIANCNKSSLMYYITGHMPVVIEPPTENTQLSDFILPPINSISKMLAYINTLSVFYNTPYRFYIDFDCAYLLSSSGKAVRKEGEPISTILLDFRNDYDETVKSKGILYDEAAGVYKLIIDEDDYEISDDHISEKSYSKLSATNTSGKNFIKEIDTSPDNNVSAKTKSIRILNDNEGLLDNMVADINNSAVQIIAQKEYIDSSVITINKEYLVKMDEIYADERYNGRYILTRKRDVFIRTDNSFTCNTMLMIKKVSDI